MLPSFLYRVKRQVLPRRQFSDNKPKMPQLGFIRTKVLQADKPGGLTSPFVAVNVKEAMNIPGQ